MNRFVVVYQLEDDYQLIGCDSFGQADWLQSQLVQTHGGTPVGIYDVGANSFDWEPVRRHFWAKLSVEEQAQQDQAIIQRLEQLHGLTYAGA